MNWWLYGQQYSNSSLKFHFQHLIRLQHNLIGISRENVDTYPRAYGDEPKGVIIMESNSCLLYTSDAADEL